jgi:mono/diheme cytochrome c family protein
MKTVFKVVGGLLATLVIVVCIVLVAGNVMASRKMQRIVEVAVTPLAKADDEAAKALGKYLFSSRGCSECHGANGAGKVMIDAPDGMFVKTPNITSAGSATAKYQDADWIKAIRHGVKPDGRPLMIMPSEDYARMSDPDLAALVAYVRGLPETNGSAAEVRLPLIVKTLYGLGAIEDAAQKIDHSLPVAQPIAVGPTAEYGKYVANMCAGCHGPQFSGGKIPGGPPHWPAAANLTPGAGSAMPRYDNAEKFAAMLRTGKRPDGSAVDPAMPFESLAALNETDVAALYAFIKTLPPVAAGNR